MDKTSRQEIGNSLKLRKPSEVTLLILMHPTEIMSLVTDPDQSHAIDSSKDMGALKRE